MLPRVSVVICTWNRARLLEQTLDRFERLEVPEGVDWELLVVNNNCTDDTDSVVRRFADRLPVVLCHEPRPGKSNACNRAIAVARGEFMLWTDDDALVDPRWMVETLGAFDRFQADMVFGRVLPWWETEPPPWFSRQFEPVFALLDYGEEARLVTERGLTPYGVNYAFRTDVFRRLGGFVDDLGPLKGRGGGNEDTEIFRRLLCAGQRVVYVPQAVVHHFIPSQRCTKNFNRYRAWGASPDHYSWLTHITKDVPWLLGLPRYFVRLNLGYALEYLKAMLRRDRSSAFYNELRLIRFAGLLRCAVQESFRRGERCRI